MNNIKTMTATEFDKRNAVYSLLSILDQYKSIVITHHGQEMLVIHKPDAPVVEIEKDDINSAQNYTPAI